MKKRILLSLISALTLISMFSISVFAGNTAVVTTGKTTASGAYALLVQSVETGSYINQTDGVAYDFAANQYKTSGGGYLLYTEISSAADTSTDFVNEVNFKLLTSSAKQNFLKDELTIANAMAYDTSAGVSGSIVSDETVTDMMDVLQQKSGMGSQLMATLLANTKPDYVSANRIYKPFSGIIGTVLGLISILVLSLLGVVMALDISYIVIPPFQLILDGDSDGGKEGGTKGMSRLISAAARNAVKVADGDGNGQGGTRNKMALGVYFKYRWKELVVLGICLLYLVQGQIYNFVAWILDLSSGFLGF